MINALLNNDYRFYDANKHPDSGYLTNGSVKECAIFNLAIAKKNKISKKSFLFKKFGKFFGLLRVKKSKTGIPITLKKDTKGITKNAKKLLYNAKWILFNQERYHIICIDIDKYSDDYFDPFFYIDNNYPIPNLILTTDKGLQLFYFLQTPVFLNSPEHITNYYFDIVNKLTIAFKGDKNMNKKGTCRNPFAVGNPVYFIHNHTFSLHELNLENIEYTTKTHVKNYRFFQTKNLGNFTEIKFNYDEFTPGNRNKYMFIHLLAFKTVNFYDYNKKKWKISDEQIFDILLHYATKINEKAENPLSHIEIEQIVKSVSRPKYFYYKKIKTKKLYFEPNTPLKERQRAGALYTAKVKRNRTEEKIKTAIMNIIRDKKKIILSMKELSKITNIPLRTVYRYKEKIWGMIIETFRKYNMDIGDNLSSFSYIYSRKLKELLHGVTIYNQYNHTPKYESFHNTRKTIFGFIPIPHAI